MGIHLWQYGHTMTSMCILCIQCGQAFTLDLRTITARSAIGPRIKPITKPIQPLKPFLFAMIDVKIGNINHTNVEMKTSSTIDMENF